MKKVLLVLVAMLFTIEISAKPNASAIWYLYELCKDSQYYDDNIEVIYTGRVKYANPANSRGPVPILTMSITNKTDKIIYIDLANCFIKKNEYASQIYKSKSHITGNTTANSIYGGIGIIGSSSSNSNSNYNITEEQQYIAIPPKSVYEKDIVLYEHGDERIYNYNLIYFTDHNYDFSAKQKRDYIFSYEYKDLKVGDYIKISEDEAKLHITGIINYSFTNDFKELHTLSSKYYASHIFGSKYILNPWSTKEWDIVNKTIDGLEDNSISSTILFFVRLWAPR